MSGFAIGVRASADDMGASRLSLGHYSDHYPPNNSASPRRQGDVMGTACRRRFSTSYSLPFVDSQRRRLDGALDVVFNVVSTSYERRDPTSRVTS